MKIRFGEFPEHHHFLLIMRPFVDWTFKFFGWLILTSTIRFAYEKTENQFLQCLMWFCYILLLGFVGAFVDWILSFKRDRVISGKALVAVAELGTKERATKASRFFRALQKTRQGAVVVITLLVTFVLIGASNFATDKIIEALIEFHQKVR